MSISILRVPQAHSVIFINIVNVLQKQVMLEPRGAAHNSRAPKGTVLMMAWSIHHYGCGIQGMIQTHRHDTFLLAWVANGLVYPRDIVVS
jgi:hypothetical protein